MKSSDSKDYEHAQRMMMLRDNSIDINIVDVFASQEEQKLSSFSDADLERAKLNSIDE